jgi:hypothetical protein
MDKNKFPENWDENRTKRIIAHYEAQTEEEAVLEDEAMFEQPEQTLIEIPVELVPAVRALLANYYGGHQVPT